MQLQIEMLHFLEGLHPHYILRMPGDGQTDAKVVGRLVSVSPRDSERFHLKLIINRIPGATSYEDLRTHDNVLHKMFREAAIAMGLTECSDEAIAVLEEAAKTLMPKQMRRFFAYYLIGDEPSDARQL
ncbi:hypothetical protein JTE90_026662 [Oedothorax gibbosus]|uniref:Uncharacterized protein n=1 Tax=Oedothorax gibbosus TaxID=931172 RepID=A0AAV6TRW9_9ARAC|nr:hypothetical protein JTE90_026662 [Oedothorax gibbosus]